MLKNYIKIAWRNIINKPFYSLVNIAGLSAGIAFTLIIAAFVWSEATVNSKLKNADRQYIIQSKWKNPSQGYELATSGQLAKALHENYPTLVENYYRYDGITTNVSKGDKAFREGLQVGDSTLFTMYGFHFLYGDPNTALHEPFSAVITDDRAIKYFGHKDVIGETITIENFSGSKHDFMIRGVMKTPAWNSVTRLVNDYPNDIYVATNNLAFFGRNMNWDNISIASYVELKKGVTPKDLEKPIEQLLKQNTQYTGALVAYLTPLKKYYLTANNGLVKKMLYALSAIALFILLMAIINFINMSVSRSSARMREIGIRKVLGGMKRQLVIQFLVESILLVFFSTLLALAIYTTTKDLFTSVLGKPVPSLSQFPVYFAAVPLLFVILAGIAAGLYPAFVLSSIKTVQSLKGKLNAVREKVWLRKSLVAFQFGTATIVFTGAIIISKQISHFFSNDLGYNKDFIVSAQVPRDWSTAGVNKMEVIREQFAAMPQVKAVSLSFEVPNGANSGSTFIYRNGTDSTSAISTQLLTTDEFYATAYSIPMAAGVFYSEPRETLTDSTKLVINETEAKAFGWKSAQEAIGGQLRFPGSPGVFTIVGVSKDFHFGSMQQAIQPSTFTHVKLGLIFRFLSFKLEPGNIGNSMAALQKQWTRSLPGAPFEYKFMDETLRQLYQTEIQLKRASYTATILSVIIVLLGVIGLVSLSIRKRTKEIGIRKVLGSSIGGIIGLFIKEFLWIIITGGLIACPVAWLIMNRWLNDYAYRISLNAQPFVFSIAGLGIVTALLITLQTMKAGTDNPVKSLRTE